MLTGITIAVAVTALWIVVQVACMHVRPAAGRFQAMRNGYVLSLPLVYAAWRWLPLPGLLARIDAGQPEWIVLVHAYILHLLLFFLYVECFYHVERAVTLRLLVEIHNYPSGEPLLDDLRGEYTLDDMIERRLEVLRRNGYVSRSGERWQLQPKGRLFATCMKFSSWVFRSQGQQERM